MSDLYLIVKRGLYYKPNSCGYTGIKDEAGRYSLAEVAERFPNTDSANQDGITFVAEADAPDYSEACYWDTRLKHQHDKAQAEITRLTSALAASEEKLKSKRAYQVGVAVGMASERERCAVIAENISPDKNKPGLWPYEIAKAIRSAK